jgi:hypothetical protein
MATPPRRRGRCQPRGRRSARPATVWTSLRRRQRHFAAGPLSIQRRTPGTARRADRHPLLRHLPLRPAHGARRVEQRSCRPSTRACRATRSSAASPRSAAREGAQGRRSGRRRLPRRLRPQLPAVPAHSSRTSAPTACSPTTRPTSTPAASPTAATRSASSSTSTSCCACRRTSTCPAWRRCCAPASPPGRRCAAGIKKGHKVGIVGLGGLGHMGVKLVARARAHTVVLTTSPGKKDDAKRLGADDVIVTRTPTRWRSTPARSTSCSTRSAPTTTSTRCWPC